MDSAVLSSDVSDQPANVESEDALDDLFWSPAEGAVPGGPHADERFIL
jgi:hypothetical protein